MIAGNYEFPAGEALEESEALDEVRYREGGVVSGEHKDVAAALAYLLRERPCRFVAVGAHTVMQVRCDHYSHKARPLTIAF